MRTAKHVMRKRIGEMVYEMPSYTSHFSRFANFFSHSRQFVDKCIAGLRINERKKTLRIKQYGMRKKMNKAAKQIMEHFNTKSLKYTHPNLCPEQSYMKNLPPLSRRRPDVATVKGVQFLWDQFCMRAWLYAPPNIDHNETVDKQYVKQIHHTKVVLKVIRKTFVQTRRATYWNETKTSV